MAYLFGNAVLDLAREVGDVMEGTATGGGATTLVDSSPPFSCPADDWYNGGTIWFKACTHTGNNGTSGIITDFDETTGTATFTFGTVADTHIQSGDTYAAMTNEWPRYVLRQAVNKALMEIGDVDQQDITTTTVANQEYYTLPTGYYNVRKVEVASNSSAPYDYYELNHWHEIEGQIQFESGYHLEDTGHILRLTCNMPLAEITADTTAIPTLVHPQWLKWAGAVYAYRWRMKRVGDDEQALKELLNEALAQAMRNESRYRHLLKRTPAKMEHSIWDTSIWETRR